MPLPGLLKRTWDDISPFGNWKSGEGDGEGDGDGKEGKGAAVQRQETHFQSFDAELETMDGFLEEGEGDSVFDEDSEEKGTTEGDSLFDEVDGEQDAVADG